MSTLTSYPPQFQAIIHVAEHVAKEETSSEIAIWHMYLAFLILDYWAKEASYSSEKSISWDILNEWKTPFETALDDESRALKMLEKHKTAFPGIEEVTELLNNETPHSLPLTMDSHTAIEYAILLRECIEFDCDEPLGFAFFIAIIMTRDKRVIESLNLDEKEIDDLIQQTIHSVLNTFTVSDAELSGQIIVQALTNSGHGKQIMSIIKAIFNKKHGRQFGITLINALIFGCDLGKEKTGEAVIPKEKPDLMTSILMGLAILGQSTTNRLQLQQSQTSLTTKIPCDTILLAITAMINTLPLPQSEG